MANGLSACLCIRRTGVSSRLNWGTGRKAFAKGMKPYQRCDFAGNSEISIVENAERISKREFAKRGIDKPLDGLFRGRPQEESPCRQTKNAGRAREGFGPLELPSWPAACTATAGADFAAGICRIPAKSGESGRGEGSLLPRPPACQKVCLDKLKALAGLDQTARAKDGYAVFAEQAEKPGILENRIGEAWDRQVSAGDMS